jgi:hypothetical protein
MKMADRSKFEEMLERLINEDKDGAEELFHEIVVEKSRDIYNNLLEDESEVDESDDEVEEATDEEVDESDEDLDEASDEEVDESDEEVEEGFDLDEFEVEADPMDAMMGGDAGDDMEMDIDMDGGDEEGDDEGDEGDVEDRVEDLEDALDDLKAEFEKMMAGDDEGDDMDDMGDDEGEEEPEEAFAFEASDEEVEEAADEEVEESDEDLDEGKMKDSLIGDSEKMSKAEFAKKHGKEAADEHYESAKSAGEQMREYVEKVSATMGDNGVNNKSAHASPNHMGDGTSANILNGGEDNGGGDHAGLADINAKEDDAGNINKPGGKASKAGKSQPGHGAEKKGKPEAAADKKSSIGS